MKQFILLLLISTIFAGNDQITKDEWVSDLIELAKNRVTQYRKIYIIVYIMMDING